MVRDMDTDQHLPTDLITEEEAAMYQVLEQDDQVPDDDAKLLVQHQQLITTEKRLKPL